MTMSTDQVLDENLQSPKEWPVQYASFGYRLLAYILDFLVLIPVVALTMYNQFVMKSFILALLLSLAGVIYKVLMEGSYGATLGKMALKMKVVDADGDKISFSEAATRAWPFIIAAVVAMIQVAMLFNHPEFIEAKVSSLEDFAVFGEIQNEASNPVLGWIPLIVILVAVLPMLGHSEKQGLHDRTAKTYVIKKY